MKQGRRRLHLNIFLRRWVHIVFLVAKFMSFLVLFSDLHLNILLYNGFSYGLEGLGWMILLSIWLNLVPVHICNWILYTSSFYS
jgi:hypothetical protein